MLPSYTFLNFIYYFCILLSFNVPKRKWMWKKQKYNLVYSKAEMYMHDARSHGLLKSQGVQAQLDDFSCKYTSIWTVT